MKTLWSLLCFAFRFFSALLFCSLVLAVACYLVWKWQR